MKLLFLHGWQSTPGGLKPTYLKDHGHEVRNPHLPDDDFDAAVRIAQAEFDRHKPDVVVGSSRGGAVAMNIDSGDTPLVLLCPAWKTWGIASTVRPNTVILHSRADETVPFADSEELVRNSGLPPESLIEVGFEHRLADEESLAMMLKTVESITMQQELPVWIERFLKRGFCSCSEPEYVQFRQDRLRKSVLEIADAHENGRKLLHDACVEHLGDSNEDVVRNALSCLFVLGTGADVAFVEPILQHPTRDIRKAARTCLFEIKRRLAGTQAKIHQIIADTLNELGICNAEFSISDTTILIRDGSYIGRSFMCGSVRVVILSGGERIEFYDQNDDILRLIYLSHSDVVRGKAA